MAKISILLTSLFIISNMSLTAQSFTQNNVFEGEGYCGCEILLFTIEDPSVPPTLTVAGPHGTIGGTDKVGDLNEFTTFENGICKRNTYVKVREYKNAQIRYFYEEMVNDVNSLLKKYKNYTTICFEGHFNFNNIDIGYAKHLKLLENTVFHYQGDGTTPGIEFNNIGSSIEGGEIRTDTPMNEGMVSIISEGANSTNANSNQIKNIKLSQENNNYYGPNETARNDRAVVLANPFESLVAHTEHGTNYYTNISNVDIEGYAVGLHMRGWSNAALIRNIYFKNVSAYGLWVSGCIDNSFSNLKYESCTGAYAIRMDNYVDERYSNFSIGDQDINLTDPNFRESIETHFQLSSLLSNSADQEEFNLNLNELLINNIDPPSYYSLLEACGGSTTSDPFGNKVEENGGNFYIRKFGLKGYEHDKKVNFSNPYFNYEDDELGLFDVLNSPDPNTINFYNIEYNHNITGQEVADPPIELEEATCSESSGLTSFFRKPAFNTFAGINLYANNSIQVLGLLEIRGREDDLPLEQRLTEDSNSSYDTCFYNVNNVQQFIPGFKNTFHLCDVPTGVNVYNLVNDVLGCGFTDTSNNESAIKIEQH